MALCNPVLCNCYTLISLAILHLQTLPYQNRVVVIFPLACMAKWPIYTGIKKSS